MTGGEGARDMPAARHALGELTWPEVDAASPDGVVVAIPIGSLEQHGPHLPLDTDTRVACRCARGLAERVDSVLVAPPLSFGASGEHAGFAGTLSIGQEALAHTLIELGRSADAFAGVVFVSGHGGNAPAVADACRVLVGEGRRVLAWSPSAPGGDAHAGRTETSLLLAIEPSLVQLEVAERGVVTPLSALFDRLRAEGVRSVSASGVLGDPQGASADEGRRLLAALVDDLVDQVVAWRAEGASRRPDP